MCMYCAKPWGAFESTTLFLRSSHFGGVCQRLFNFLLEETNNVMKVLHVICWCWRQRDGVGKRPDTCLGIPTCIQREATPIPPKGSVCYPEGTLQKHSTATPRSLNWIINMKSYCVFMVSVHLFSHPFKKYLLCIYCMPGILLGARNRVVSKRDKVPAFVEFTFYCQSVRHHWIAHVWESA